MTTTIIYGDLLFLMNFIPDFVLLYAVAQFGNFRTRAAAIFFSALVGALFGLWSVFPSFPMILNNPLGKIAVSILMVKIAFYKEKGKNFFLAFCYFYLISFAMAGAVLGVSYFLENMGFQETFNGITSFAVAVALLIGLFIGHWGISFAKTVLRANEITEEISITINKKTVTVKGLYDTGNELKEPVSKSSVIVVEFNAIKELLPKKLAREFFESKGQQNANLLMNMKGSPCFTKLRLVPFSSIGKKNGLMLAIKPEDVFLHRRGKHLHNVVIGLYYGDLYTKENCQCIISPTVLD